MPKSKREMFTTSIKHATWERVHAVKHCRAMKIGEIIDTAIRDYYMKVLTPGERKNVAPTIPD